jgi:DNA-directed RNA polymerase specialized sigma24 family protein
MDELDKLALEAQQHPAKSNARKKALTKLIMAIQASGKLYCKGRYDYPPEVYNEALQEVWLKVCEHIDRYDRSKANAITWVNDMLKWRFQDAVDKHRNRKRVSQDNQRKWVQTLSLDAPVKSSDSDGESGETFLDSIAQNQPSMLLQELRDYIQEDPEGVFQHWHIINHPEANYRTIALSYLEDKSWAEILAVFDNQITYGKITSFFRHSCRHFAPQFQDYLDRKEGLG